MNIMGNYITIIVDAANISRWHADIKPDNILIVNGDLKLADPGYAEFAKLIEGQKPPPMRVRAWTVTYGWLHSDYTPDLC